METTKRTLLDLQAKSQHGNLDAIHLFTAEMRDIAYKSAYGSDADREDAAQATALKLFSILLNTKYQFSDDKQLIAFIARVAKQMCWSLRHTSVGKHEFTSPGNDQDELFRGLSAPPTQEHVVLQKDRFERLLAVLDQTSRVVVLMREFGYSNREIEKILPDINAQRAGQLWFEAKKIAQTL